MDECVVELEEDDNGGSVEQLPPTVPEVVVPLQLLSLRSDVDSEPLKIEILCPEFQYSLIPDRTFQSFEFQNISLTFSDLQILRLKNCEWAGRVCKHYPVHMRTYLFCRVRDLAGETQQSLWVPEIWPASVSRSCQTLRTDS